MTEQVGEAGPVVAKVLLSLPPIVLPLWLVTHRDVRTSRRVRFVADFLATHLMGKTNAPGPTWVGRKNGEGSVINNRQHLGDSEAASNQSGATSPSQTQTNCLR
jgi:hypothetical protein